MESDAKKTAEFLTAGGSISGGGELDGIPYLFKLTLTAMCPKCYGACTVAPGASHMDSVLTCAACGNRETIAGRPPTALLNEVAKKSAS